MRSPAGSYSQSAREVNGKQETNDYRINTGGVSPCRAATRSYLCGRNALTQSRSEPQVPEVPHDSACKWERSFSVAHHTFCDRICASDVANGHVENPPCPIWQCACPQFSTSCDLVAVIRTLRVSFAKSR